MNNRLKLPARRDTYILYKHRILIGQSTEGYTYSKQPSGVYSPELYTGVYVAKVVYARYPMAILNADWSRRRSCGRR